MRPGPAEGARSHRGETARRLSGGAARACGRRARDRQLRAGNGAQFEEELAGSVRRSRSPRSPSRSAAGVGSASRPRLEGGGDVYALNGDELLDLDFAALLARHRRPARRPRSRSPGRPRRSASSSSETTTWSRASRRRSRPVLGQLRRLRARRRGAVARCPSGATTRRRHFPSSPRAGGWARSGTRVCGSPSTRRRTCAVPRSTSPRIPSGSRHERASRSSLDRVEKPWGCELIWALTDDYCGKLLFVKRGRGAVAPVPRVKDESWYVAAGAGGARARGARRRADARRDRAGRLLPLSGPHCAPLARARGHAHRRGLAPHTRRRRPARGRYGRAGTTEP